MSTKFRQTSRRTDQEIAITTGIWIGVLSILCFMTVCYAETPNAYFFPTWLLATTVIGIATLPLNYGFVWLLYVTAVRMEVRLCSKRAVLCVVVSFAALPALSTAIGSLFSQNDFSFIAACATSFFDVAAAAGALFLFDKLKRRGARAR
jgi:riboflavin transporter FmnP